jgi:uncharacterized glyoxalase superfamily protein PhnB
MQIKLDMIGLTCKDILKSLNFYRQLGIAVADPAEGEDYVEATLETGLRISWNSIEMIKSIDPYWKDPVGHRMGLAFLCDSPEDVNVKYGEIVALGYKGVKEPWDAFWGQRYAQVEDPDGNVVDLFAWLKSE